MTPPGDGRENPPPPDDSNPDAGSDPGADPDPDLDSSSDADSSSEDGSDPDVDPEDFHRKGAFQEEVPQEESPHEESTGGGFLGEASDASGGESAGEHNEWRLFARDVVTSVLAVALLGMYLFAVSGVWPPMVAIESPSMEPNMNTNDLVFLMDNDRFQPGAAHGDTGVVTAATGAETGYERYGDGGDVIVFNPDGDQSATPIIHRAMFWVEEDENWCERALENGGGAYLGSLETDDEACIAQNSGFITKGDANDRYDQANSSQANKPVKPEWIVGTSELRVPGVGWFRLQFT